MATVVFDLDDTLYKECDYVQSGFSYVIRRLARKFRAPVEDLRRVVSASTALGKHPFDILHEHLDHMISVQNMVQWYRNHVPYLILPDESRRCITRLIDSGCKVAIITDGRSVGQWNKIHALGLDSYIPRELISISGDIGAEKENPLPWKRMMHLLPDEHDWWYVGDNPAKDFLQPNRLGWHTVMIADDGRGIHPQDVDLPQEYHAQHVINSLDELSSLIACD